jgi:phosphopantetheinyl transferase (holo-ACP synthase)
MLGIDLVHVNRIERVWNRFGNRFTNLILHEKELELFKNLLTTTTTFNAQKWFLAGR